MNRPVPVHVLTGFLGSGKTSLLRKLLADPGMSDTVVLINEFGEIGLDHLLVRELTEDVVLLSSGCVCCALKDDLSGTLSDLRASVAAGELPQFGRVVLETTGLADPLPIVQLLRSDVRLARAFELAQVVTTVDGVNGLHTAERFSESAQQIAAADFLIVTKTDVADAAEVERLGRHLSALNPTAQQLSCGRNDRLPSDMIFARPEASHSAQKAFVCLPAGDHLATSAAGVSSFVIATDQPVDLDAFIDWLDLLLASRGDSILRVKGYLATNGSDCPLVIQGVQHILDRPETMRDWPDGRPCTKLVFIARHLTRTAVERSFQSLLPASAPPASQLPAS